MTDDLAGAERLCSDCPPVGYPTDKTRCAPCPRRTSDAEGQTVEGGDDQTQMTIERFCEEARAKTGGPTPELRRVYQAYLDNQKRKNIPQPEHDRTVRLAALDEALNRIAVLWSGWVDAHGESIYGTREDFLLEGRCHASADLHKAIRSLIDQTGGEGRI